MALVHQGSTDNQSTALTRVEICWKIIIWIVSLVIIVGNVPVDVIILKY